MTATIRIDSSTVGEPERFLSVSTLAERFARLTAAPCDVGSVAVLLARLDGGRRDLLPRARLSAADGMPGDAWKRKTPHRPEAQLAVMQLGVAELLANGQPLALFGDNLFLDLDLSAANLPIGSLLRAGGVLLEVTPKAHNGCRKFMGRFGNDALRFISQPAIRPLNLRGIYLRVVEDGEVAVGDVIEVVARPPVER